jgi:hypothetical protein
MKIVYEDKWIVMEEWTDYAKSHKTRKFTVWSKCGECRLGEINYDTGWRRYVFSPIKYDKTIYSDRCELSIGYFIFCMNRKRKSKSDFTEKLIKILDEEFGKNWNQDKGENRK